MAMNVVWEVGYRRGGKREMVPGGWVRGIRRRGL